MEFASGHIVPKRRLHHAAVAIRQSSQLFVFGGCDGTSNGFFQDSWVLDFATSRWQERGASGDHPQARAGHSMISDDPSGTVLVFGGRGEDGQVFNDLHVLHHAGTRPGELFSVLNFAEPCFCSCGALGADCSPGPAS